MARKSYKRKSSRKIKVRLSPVDAQKIIETEFTDSKGNKIHFDVDISPHLPNKPMFEWYRQYNNKDE